MRTTKNEQAISGLAVNMMIPFEPCPRPDVLQQRSHTQLFSLQMLRM